MDCSSQWPSQIVRFLVEVGAAKDQANNSGVTPLWIAAHNGHLMIVRFLLEVGAAREQWCNTLVDCSSRWPPHIVRFWVEAGASATGTLFLRYLLFVYGFWLILYLRNLRFDWKTRWEHLRAVHVWVFDDSRAWFLFGNWPFSMVSAIYRIHHVIHVP